MEAASPRLIPQATGGSERDLCEAMVDVTAGDVKRVNETSEGPVRAVAEAT